MKHRILALLVLTALAAEVYGVEWRMPVRFRPDSFDTIYYAYTYFIGTRTGATNAYDAFIDVPLPPFPIDEFTPYIAGDELVTLLRESYYSPSDAGIGRTAYDWQIGFNFSTEESLWVIWQADSFPYSVGYPIYFAYVISSASPESTIWNTAPNVSAVESLRISCTDKIFIRYWDRTKIRENQQTLPTLDVNVFPNPFNELCNIQLSGFDNGHISIHDALGTKIFESDLSGEKHIIWNATNCASGVYIVCVSNGLHMRTKTIFLAK